MLYHEPRLEDRTHTSGTGIDDPKDPQLALQAPDIHRQWERAYRTPENKRFYDMAINTIADFLDAPANSRLLDAGCGVCDYAIRMAARGFNVVAIDFSEVVLSDAATNLLQHGAPERIQLQRENLLDLRFANESFDYILCWGVLMHIPDVERAISELCRVLKPEGVIVVSEANMFSPEAVTIRILKQLLRRPKEKVVRTSGGIETWATISTGRLLTRQADQKWLAGAFKQRGLLVKKRMTGQLTELYTRLPRGVLQNLLHSTNRFWFKWIRVPHISFGVITIFQKQ